MRKRLLRTKKLQRYVLLKKDVSGAYLTRLRILRP